MPRHHRTHFADSTSPYNVPAGWLAAVYVNAEPDGTFAWSQPEVDRMAGVFGINESSNPHWMQYGRCVAFEPGAASPSGVVNCVRARKEVANDAMVYVNQGNWEQAEQACIDAGEDPWWWVAAPGMAIEEAVKLTSPLRHRPAKCVQYFWGNVYDLSVLVSGMSFTKPHQFHATG